MRNKNRIARAYVDLFFFWIERTIRCIFCGRILQTKFIFQMLLIYCVCVNVCVCAMMSVSTCHNYNAKKIAYLWPPFRHDKWVEAILAMSLNQLTNEEYASVATTTTTTIADKRKTIRKTWTIYSFHLPDCMRLSLSPLSFIYDCLLSSISRRRIRRKKRNRNEWIKKWFGADSLR